MVQKQAISGKKLGIERPIGLAYRSGDGIFVIPSSSKMTLMDSHRFIAGAVTAGISDPGAIAWDARHDRLLALEQDARSLVGVPSDGKGGLDPARGERIEAPRAGLLRAAGMAVDPATGEVFVLDRLSRRILRFTPAEGQIPDAKWVTIETKETGMLAGLAYDPVSRHLFTIAVDARTLIEITDNGREAGRHDLSAADLRDPRGLVLAPSADLTDDPATHSFFVADAGGPRDHGRIVELAPAAPTVALATTATTAAAATLVQVIATSAWSPPSPDPSGITYDSINNRLIICDGEVEEMTIYAGKNVWETSLTGVVARSWTTFGPFSSEPVGAAFDADNRHLFIADDDARKVFNLNPGPDNLYGTSDDTNTSFGTLAFGSDDPEGCAYDHVNHRLFIADGISQEIYVLTPGPNGVIDGVAPAGDDQVTHFDTAQYGVDDPETVEYKEDTGTLLLLGHTNKTLVEVTVTGGFIASTDLSFAPLPNPAGITVAPSSFDPTKKSLYIVNRVVDNDADPNENDGTLIEISLSGGPGPGSNDYPVLTGNDDAEEDAAGFMHLNSSDLELVNDGSLGNQTVGLRFVNVNVPQGATISTAWVQFMVDEAQSEATNLTVQGQAADNAAPISGGFGISSRPRTAASVSWSPAPWSTIGLTGPDQRTPELKSVIQEIVNRPGWAPGNAMAIIIRGTGHRTARAFEFGTGAPVLHVEVAGGGPTNTAPVVDAGPSRTVIFPASASLDGTVTDDGLPNPPAAVTVTWSVSSGPGTVTFQNANAVDTQASFSQVGTYVLRLTASDGALSASDLMTVTVQSGNAPPIVDAGPNRTVVFPASASLDGTVTDDGFPNPPAAVTVTWSVASGPGPVIFQDPNAVDTEASFVQGGTYVLRLTANDGALSTSDSMTVTVRVNTAPVVDAGPNATVNILFGALLDGTVTDDGLPSPPAAVAVTWSVSSGPGTVTFQDANAVDTQASFDLAGTYVLRLTANDGALTASDFTTITVQPAPPPGTSVVERRVAASADDAEETIKNRSVKLASSNLELIHAGNNDQIVGMRFTGLMIPRGIPITKAWIQFTATGSNTVATSLQIRAQTAGNAPAFIATSGNVSSRPKTTASVGWTPAAWTSGQAGSAQRTPDLTAVVQAIVNRSDWTHGNALVILFTGTGTRTAAAFDGHTTTAPLLHVEY